MIQDNSEISKDNLIRSICDKKTHEALDMIRSVNKDKHKRIQTKIIQHFEQNRAMVDYGVYLNLIEGMDKDPDVKVHRRSNFYDLDDIED